MAKKKQSYQYWPQTIVALVAVTVIFIVALIGYQQPSEDSLPQVVEKKIPGTMFLTFNGKQVVLQDLIKTDKNLLVFWATWCGPCVEEIKEMPELLPLMKKKGYTPIFVNYDHEDTLVAAETFAKKYGIETAFDTKGDMLFELGISSLPVSLVVDKSGKILRTLWGGIQESSL